MASLLRGKQAGIQNDLSFGLAPDLFAIDDIARYGINSQISTLAYDPVQSLLAVGTKASQFGPGQIYILGQARVCVTLSLSRSASVQTLQFCAENLVCLDSKHDLSVYSLESKRIISNHSPPGVVTALATDPTLDYALLGMQTGEILAYDLDRESLAPFKIPNLWTQIDPRARVATIVTLQFHPRDIGTLLIGYSHGAVMYSFKLNKVMKFYQYEVPRGAPGGDSDPTSVNTIRRPRLTQALWHPTGTFILTGYEDSSLVFWDVLKDGRMIMARTLQDTNVDKPGASSGTMGGSTGTFALKEPLFRIAWCANGQDPDNTGILIAGGASTTLPTKGLTFFDLERTPVYATSSWEILTAHFESPKRQRILPTPPGAEVVDFCLIPRLSPHYAGAHDPIAVIALLSSGELITLSFPSGLPITPTNQLHVSLTFVHPFIKRATMSSVDRERWLGMAERRQQGPPILKGGAEAQRPYKRFENRSIVRTAHADGTIRLWDVGDGDEIENQKVLQVDVSRAVGRLDNVDVTQISGAAASGELAAGLRSGEIIVFKWSHNRNAGREPPPPRPNELGKLTSVTDRIDPSLSEGLCPFVLLDLKDGPVTALKLSEVGFVAMGTEGGSIAVIDLRGPAIIYKASVHEFAKGNKRGSLRRSSDIRAPKPEWATHIEFSVMTLEGDDYSSIALHVGTNNGHLATFKIVPDPSGRYGVQFAGVSNLEDRIVHIAPLNADSGRPASASQTAVANLRTGAKVNGVLIAVTQTGIRIFKPASAKGAHKTFDSVFCDAAGVVRYQDQGHAIVGLFGDGTAKAYSIPSIKEIGVAKIGHILDVRRLGDAILTQGGNVLGWTGPSEMALISVFGTGQPLPRSQDSLLHPEALIPPRPTISNVQWITGTQYITPADMDVLIGGPDRPPSKRMIAQARADETQARRAAGSAGAASAAAGQQEGYWAYMQRQMQERTEKLGMVGDSMDKLEENSSGWAEDVSKFVSRQKRAATTGRKCFTFALRSCALLTFW